MKIKKFTAQSMHEAMQKMKKELGEDAVILHSRKLGSGSLLDFQGKRTVEITAAIDEPDRKNGSAAKRTERVPDYFNPPVNRSSIAFNNDVFYEMIKREMVDIKEKLTSMGDILRYSSIPNLPENLDMVLKQLIDNEIEEKLALSLIQDIQFELKGDDYNNLKIVLSVLVDKLAHMIRCSKEATVSANRTRYIALLGPTGVGKTTTIAKLASNQKLMNNKKVGIVTLDTYRIAAVEQLRTFASIADIPLMVVYTPEEFNKALRKMSNLDVVYIDTTGRSQKDTEKLKELKSFFDAVDCDEIHLCLSVTTKPKDIIDIVDKFEDFKYNHFIFTKLDETNSLGVVLNTLNNVKKPVSYLTFGQNVPDDIERASSRKLAKMIIRRKFL